jgi:hypothetical protein
MRHSAEILAIPEEPTPSTPGGLSFMQAGVKAHLVLGVGFMSKRFFYLPIAIYLIIPWGFGAVLIAQDNAPAPPSEPVVSYESDIVVNPDSTILVRETIRVLGTGPPIRREIYRDIATHYHDRFGNPYTIHIEIVSLQRDAQASSVRLRKISNGLRIYLGRASEVAALGEHTYELTYTVDRGVGFFPEYDELYWNATGSGWTLPIQEASAAVHLPRGIAQQAILLDAYTGRPESAGTDYAASADDQGNASFHTTGALGPYESLTLVVRWPKGFVSPPTGAQQRRYFMEDHQADIIGLIGLAMTLIFFSGAWLLAGRDPARGEIAPKPDPPRGFSPAFLRYVWRNAFDQKTMVVTLVDLAIKKQLAILEDGSGGFILGRLDANSQSGSVARGADHGQSQEVTSDEKLVRAELFARETTIPLVPANHALVGEVVEVLHRRLRLDLEKFYFMVNVRYLIPGLLVSLATIVRCGYAIQGAETSFVSGLALGLLPWSLGLVVVAGLAVALWRYALSDPLHASTARREAMVMSSICLIFLIGEVVGLAGMVWAASAAVAGLLVALVAINCAFHLLLKSPRRSGRALIAQIEAFRMFLTTPEQGSRDERAPMRMTSALFERFLPYAMALNVEKVWCERFVTAMVQTTKGGGLDYSPGWYSGPGWDSITAANFATSLGNSFSSAISQSISAPGSRSRRSRMRQGDGGGGRA